VSKGRTRLLVALVAVGAAMAVTAGGSAAMADDDTFGADFTVHERLSGYQETPLALSTSGTAHFRLQIDEAGQEITYQLSYSGLEGSITQSHIHFGGRSQTGGIMVFLCSNLGNGPAGTQTCPASPGSLAGTIHASDIIGPAGQGIAAGQLDEVIAAIRAGFSYVNVHSTLYPLGEVRAQIDHRH
jgi:hypothetical protein